VFHILVGGSTPLDASDGLAIFGRGVLMTIHGILALEEVARQKGAAHIVYLSFFQLTKPRKVPSRGLRD